MNRAGRVPSARSRDGRRTRPLPHARRRSRRAVAPARGGHDPAPGPRGSVLQGSGTGHRGRRRGPCRALSFPATAGPERSAPNARPPNRPANGAPRGRGTGTRALSRVRAHRPHALSTVARRRLPPGCRQARNGVCRTRPSRRRSIPARLPAPASAPLGRTPPRGRPRRWWPPGSLSTVVPTFRASMAPRRPTALIHDFG